MSQAKRMAGKAKTQPETKPAVPPGKAIPLKRKVQKAKTISVVLAHEWRRRGISSTVLAAMTGLQRSRIREIMSGATPNPGIITVVALLNGLGRDLDWLADQMKKSAKRTKPR